MEADGYESEFASNGLEGISKAESFRPDLILLDVMMPQLDGFETCRRLKAKDDTRYIPVIMLTARGELEDKLMGLEVGAEDYIVKPYSLVEISARVRSLLAVRALYSRLRESEKMAALGEMVDGIAHELRNPLTTVGGMARRLYEAAEKDVHKRYAATIMSSVERMERMMLRIDEYKGILASTLRPGDINSVVGKAVQDASALTGDKQININTNLMPDAPPVSIDPTNLKIAIFNIIQNSIEAIESKGEITLETSLLDENTLVLKIADDGVGMSEEFVRNIFHPFYTSKMTGAGLGLTISYRIIQDHNGVVEVESAEGVGTTFTIKLVLTPGAVAT
jgi:signal transduction histidine kinase